MELSEVLLKRRSIRRFEEKAVSDDVIQKLLHAGMSGPSACNRTPWEFYVVKSAVKLKELKSVATFSKYDAPLAIVVCGNLSRALPVQLAEFWVQDCSAATENVLLAVTDLGLGAVWCGVYPQKRVVERVKKCLNLPEKHIPLNIIYIGYPKEEQPERDQYSEKRVHIIE